MLSTRSEPFSEGIPEHPIIILKTRENALKHYLNSEPNTKSPTKKPSKNLNATVQFCSSSFRKLKKKRAKTHKEHIISPEKYSLETKKFPSTL